MNRFRTSANSIIIFVVALGMMCALLSIEVYSLVIWIAHIGTIVSAYVAGTLMPENRVNKITRRDDPK